jgi:predicted DNA-binding transcriptional regulator AlpA
MTTTGDLILNEFEAARTLRISPRTLQRLRAQGGGPPAVRVSARRIGYRVEDLDTWIRARAVVGASSPVAKIEGAM